MKSVVLISGGIDSTTLLYYVVRRLHEDVVAVTFQYGQRHRKEILYARHHCKLLRVPHVVIRLPKVFVSALTSVSIDVPLEDYSVETQRITVVPYRNTVFLSLAAAYAASHEARKVYYAAHKNDRAVYPDCRPVFVEKLNELLKVGHYVPVEVHAPFIDMYKWDIVKLGSELRVDYGKTWSCYLGGEVHCGLCGTCRERQQAFKRAGIPDPTVYLHRIV